jgi:F-type H+-transporting ATPase subunit epsilon
MATTNVPSAFAGDQSPRTLDRIDLEIVTPQGRALHRVVDEVTAPSVKGEFGVLPGHLPLLAAVRTGIVTYREGSESKKCAVGPGFAEAGANKMVILTEDFIERDKIDPVVVRKELAEVQELIRKLELSAAAQTNGEVEEQLRLAIQKENWLAVELELYGDPPPATMRPHEQWGPPPSPHDEEEHPLPGPDTTPMG